MAAILGEAPETESEEEIDTENPQKDKVKERRGPQSQHVILPQMGSAGRIVAGEAPESDDEIEEGGSCVSSAASVSSLASLSGSLSQHSLDGKNHNLKPKDEVKYKSLLHKKLRANNMHMWRGVNDVVHFNINQAARDLNFADQQLLKSQGVLQDTSAQLRILGSNLSQLNELLNMITASPFLPNIHIPEEGSGR